MSNMPSSYVADSGATVTFTPSDSDEEEWFVDATRTVQTNGYYRFGVAAASTLTSDQVLAAVNTQGWSTKSISAPPPNVAQALASLGQMGLTSWWIHAIWTGSPSTIPDSIAPLFYGPIEQYIGPVPTGSNVVTLPTTVISGPVGVPSNLLPVLGLLTGAAMVAFAVWISKGHR
jgi:hypothetical protein